MALDFNPFERDNQQAIQTQQEKMAPTRIKVFEKNSPRRKANTEKLEPTIPKLKEDLTDKSKNKIVTNQISQNGVPQIDIPQNRVCQNEISEPLTQRELPQSKEFTLDQYPIKHSELAAIESEPVFLSTPLPTQNFLQTDSTKQGSQNDISQNGVPQIDIPQNRVCQNEIHESQKLDKASAKTTTNLGINYGGYFPLRCSFFSPELFLKLNEGETKILLYLSFLSWRYGAKFGGARASVSYISKGTGISESSVNRHLKNLLKYGSIEQIRTDMRNGNVYKITHSLVYFENVKEHDIPQNDIPQIDIPQNGVPQIDIEGMSKLPRTSVNLAEQVCQNGIQDLTSSILLKLSLPQFLKSSQLAELETRWMSFMKREREREEKGLLKLFQQKPEEAEIIFKAFEIVLKEQDEYGEIKSAISVLETNYTGQFRAKALAAIARQQQKQKENQLKAETQKAQAETEDAEAKMQLIRMQCFQEAFPDMAIRKQCILNICRENPMFSKFGVNSPLSVSYAISQWAQGEGSSRVLAALDQETTQAQN